MDVLVTGATGYIGGRLIPRLLAEGHAVRAMTRDAGRLRDVPWAGQVRVVVADALGDGLDEAMAGVEVAYYLVHSIGSGASFEDTDRQAAEAFGAAAKRAGVRRIVYLGGLSPATQELSPHLRSRAEVGQILLDSGVPTAVLQAAVILGSGSASFEML
ncbi:MAG: NAD-dependent epimerase/dehydratase family protein, partial [Frankiales bacterium]